ncbi:aggregation-promoting factor C-terminal-like domain-containing protein [Rhodococcus sp. 5G237]
MAENIGYASLSVIPVLSGLQGNLQQMMRPLLNDAQRVGVQMGNNVAQGLQGAESRVRQASQRMAQARNAETDAAGRARLAEAELNEVRARGDAATSDLIRAEERLRIAQREATDATRQRERAVDELSQAQADLANSTDDVEQSTDSASGGLGTFGDAASGAAGKLAGLATAVVGIGSAIELGMQGIENQQITNKLAASMGATGDLAAEYGQKAGELYRNGFGESMEEAASTIGLVASSFQTAGFEGEKSMEEISATALDFATIFDQDVANSIQTASLLVTNGLAKDSTEAFDLMTASFQRVPAAMREELPEILQEYGTNFRALGLNGEESFSLLVSAAEQGKFALDKTGDALKEFTIRGADMSTASSDAYKAIGLDAVEMSNMVAAGGEGAREALQRTAAGLLAIEDPADRANQAIALFGTPLEDLSVDQIPAFLEGITGAQDNMAGFAGSAAEAGDTLNSGVGVAFETFKRQVTGELLDGLNNMASFLMRNAETFKTLGMVIAPVVAGIGTYVAVTKTITGVQAAWTAVTKAGTIAQWAMNAAMAANPIGLIVAAVVAAGAALALFFTKTEVGRKIWDKVWNGIKTAVSTAWEYLQVAFDGIMAAFGWVGDKAMWLWNSALVPAFNGITTAVGWLGDKANWLWSSVIQPVFGFIGQAAQVLMAIVGTVLITPFILAWNAIGATVQLVWNTFLSPIWETMKAGLGLLGQAFSWVWNSVIKPAWDALGAGIQWVYNSIINPTWEALKAALAAVGGFFQATWNNVIKPAWDALGAGIQWVWNSIINPTWEALKTALSAVGTFFQNTWNNVIKPAWDALGNGIKWVWDNVVNPVWEAMKGALDTLKSSFDTAVGFIGQVWDRIKSIVAKPVRFVVETVYNNGIRAAWNKVAGFLGLDELQEANLGELAHYATGGHVRGAGGPTDDKIPAMLSNGEYVLRADAVKQIGVSRLDQMNQNPSGFRKGESDHFHYATGGVVQAGAEITTDIQRSMWDAVRTAFPNASLNSGTRYADVGSGYDFHMAGQAIDLGGPMQQIANWIASTYPNALELFWDPGPNIDEGRPTGAIGGHSDHVHWAMSEIVGSDGRLVSADAGSSGSGGGPGFFRRMIAGLFDGIMDPIGGMIPTFGDSQIGQLPKLAFDKFRTSVRDWILGQADAKGGSSGGSFDVAPGSGPVVDQVREAFSAYGWGDGPQWDAAQWIVGRESGWDPMARNPQSGAFGLAQFLGSTKDQYLPDENPNPKVQGDAMARYIRDRYGDPLAAKAFWEQNGWYDQGGLASGVGVMLKNVIQPERVLSPEMTKHFERLVDVMEKPEFIDALTKLAPAGADAPDAQPGGSATAPAPVGGTGVDATYTSEENTDWGARASKIGSDFLSANVDQFKSDLGLPSGDGFISQLAKQGVKVVEEHIHYHVTNIDEAMRKERERRQKEALTFSRRG